MKFIVDIQVFQTDTWHRGMGKYSLAILKALQAGGHFKKYSLEFIINSNLTLDKDREALLTDLFPGVKFTSLDLRTTNAINVQKVQAFNKKQIDIVFKSPEDIFFMPSLFENEVTPVFPTHARKLLLGYDLIPLFFYDRYMTHSEPVRNNYFGRFSTIFEADHIFAISQTTTDDYVRHLGLPLDMLTNIDGASIGLTNKASRPKYVPRRKFIISPSGDDIRKNNERMVSGFAEFNKEQGGTYELLITSNFSKRSQQILKKISPDIHFVGNIPEEDLRWYYKHAASMLFVPEYEGLGLPVLEAVQTNQKVVCSSIAVFREMTTRDDAFHFCDPYDVWSIRDALKSATAEGLTILEAEYAAIKKKYSWSRSADLFAKVCDNLESRTIDSSSKRLKLAVLGPLPGGKSAIGKVIDISHYELSKHADVDYYFEIPKEDVSTAKRSFIEYTAKTATVADFSKEIAAQYDAVVYHLGSSTYHLKTIVESLAVPGITILHDTRFEGVYNCMVSERVMSQARVDAESKLDELLDVTTHSDHIVSIVNAAKEVVVHSTYTQDAVKGCLVQSRPVTVAGLPIGLSSPSRHLANKRVNIAMAGIISKSKGLDLLVSLLESEEFDDCDFTLFGYDYAVGASILASLGSYKNLTIKRNLSNLEFREQLEKSDILLNYRDYYHGETSYATLEAMRESVVPLVRDIGWFSELPDDVVVKVEFAEEAAAALKRLIGNREHLKVMAEKSYQYAIKQHSPSGYVAKLLERIDTYR